MIKTQAEARQAYKDMLNECYTVEKMKAGNPHWSYRDTPAQMMKYNDPTMYDCGFNDWIDGMVQDRQAVSRAVDFCA